MRIETVAIHAGTHVDPEPARSRKRSTRPRRSSAIRTASYPRGYLYSPQQQPQPRRARGVPDRARGRAPRPRPSPRPRRRRRPCSWRSRPAITWSRRSTPTTAPAAAARHLRAVGARRDFVDMTDVAAVRARAAARTRGSSGWRRRRTRCGRSPTSRASAAIAHGGGRPLRVRQHDRDPGAPAAVRARRRPRRPRHDEVPRRPRRRDGRRRGGAGRATTFFERIRAHPGARAARCRRRSTAGSCAAGSARCRIACARTREQRPARSPRSWHAPPARGGRALSRAA